MNERTASLFLILCMVILFGLFELENKWDQDQEEEAQVRESEQKLLADQRRKGTEAEAEKFQVLIKHDGSPETNTATIILDAGSSFDPNKMDDLKYNWSQIAGSPVELKPGENSAKVTFKARPGDYAFEIEIFDSYGSAVKDTKMVKIIPEPNDPPVLETKVSVQ